GGQPLDRWPVRALRRRHPRARVLAASDLAPGAAGLSVPLPGSGAGSVEHLVVGTGAPVTVFAHGLGGSIVDTRPLASGVDGTRVFLHFRGHGATTVTSGGYSYDDLVTELLTVADAFGAT